MQANLVRCNQKQLICENCKDIVHASCFSKQHLISNARIPSMWTCNNCLHTVLLFHNICYATDITTNENDDTSINSSFLDENLNILDRNKSKTSIATINTQSLLSSFDEFTLLLNTYHFDIISLTETWLQNQNQHQHDNVQIDGYKFVHKDRIDRRGGGVGIYIKDNIVFKERKELTSLNSTVEHQWIEVKGRNKNNSFLFGVFLPA